MNEYRFPGLEEIFGPLAGQKRESILILDNSNEDGVQPLSDRIIEEYKIDGFFTVSFSAKEFLQYLSKADYDNVSLCSDPRHDYEDLDKDKMGMAVVRYLEKTGWPEGKRKPRFYIHSTNVFAAFLMQRRLTALGLCAEWRPIDDHQSPHLP